ncbi:MAG: galactose ABC transporter substrate-binding protein [Solobacterium sp.]|jgi:methyl-galactoside transport system substrate-binding protein|nr:galactose ABC transporter substrate-binding protein [Solobacterium sp.]MCH4222776.1 galactose ABC transporter substrate-binding protein [Solobacterium sp.]
MKRLLACFLALSLLTGCSAGKNADKKVKIGVTVYDSYDTFISELMTNFNADVTSRENITIETYNANKSQTSQNKQVEDMINDGCDVICVNLVDRTAPKKIIDLARKNNVPIIFFNRELVEEDLQQWEGLYYVGADAEESGVMEGEIAADACKQDGADKNGDGMIQYIVLEGEAGHQDAIVRTEKSVNTLIQDGLSVDKITSAIANWNRSQAQTKMAQYITQYGSSIELVLGNNDDMSLGAIDAYKAAEIDQSDWPVIVGIDGTKAGLQAVENHEMVGTVYNDQKGQATAMANLAYALATGGSLDDLGLTDGKYIWLPYQKVTQDNVSDYLSDMQ